MKTIILNLLLAITILSSCNTAKQYANYRFGGKSDREEKVIPTTQQSKEITIITPEETKADSASNSILHVNEIALESNTINEKITRKEIKPTKKESKEITPKSLKKSNFSPSSNASSKLITKQIQKQHNQSAMKKSGFNVDDLIYTLGVIAIIAGGAFSFYMLGVTMLEILTFVGGMILVVILLSLLGNAIMGIFPGMSKKNKKTFSIKNILGKIFPSRSMKYYGGMSVKTYFWIGLGAIALAMIIMAIVGASSLGWEIIMGILGAHLFISAISALLVGFMSLFPGMSFKKSKSK